jgi:hypothetical protein
VLHPPGEAPEEDELAEAQRRRDTPDDLVAPSIEVLKASAHFDRVLYDGGEFGTATAPGSAEEEDFLGLPGLLDPEQVTHLLRQRQADQLKNRSRGQGGVGDPAAPGEPVNPAGTGALGRTSVAGFGPGSGGRAAVPAPGPDATADTAPPVSREALAALRKELNGLVAAWNHRTGQPHGVIHNDLRKACGGPPLPQATADQIRARIDQIRRWAATRR